MKTIKINVYSFDELSSEAQQNVINQERQNFDCTYIYDEARKTIDTFCNLFNIDLCTGSFSEFKRILLDNCEAEDLKGLRLYKYVQNNFTPYLYKGKYFSLWSKVDQNPHYTKNGSAPWGKLKSRHSKIMLENSGICYNDSLSKPVYDFIKDFKRYSKHYSLYSLLSDCFRNLRIDIENEESYLYSDEGIKEILNYQDNLYFSDGSIYQ